jgi:hypothetical protein
VDRMISHKDKERGITHLIIKMLSIQEFVGDV